MLNFLPTTASSEVNLIDQASLLVGRIDFAYGAMLGALAIIINARLALLAPLLIAGLELARRYEVDLHPAFVEALPLLAAIFITLGIVQALVSALAGRDAAATLIGVVVGGVVLFTLWRGPIRIVRLLARGRI